jgi:hypothetical protein
VASRRALLLFATGLMLWLEGSPAGAMRLYWSVLFDRIESARSDGGDRQGLVFGVGIVHGLALDLNARRMYWTNVHGQQGIFRSRLNGSDVETLVTSGLIAPSGLALDVPVGKTPPPQDLWVAGRRDSWLSRFFSICWVIRGRSRCWLPPSALSRHPSLRPAEPAPSPSPAKPQPLGRRAGSRAGQPAKRTLEAARRPNDTDQATGNGAAPTPPPPSPRNPPGPIHRFRGGPERSRRNP